jgi:hypothetical protein
MIAKAQQELKVLKSVSSWASTAYLES